MALTAADILTPVSAILLDESNTRWSAASLLTYLNEAQRQLVTFRPEAGVSSAMVHLDTGVKQTLPTGGRSLKDVTRNVWALRWVSEDVQWNGSAWEVLANDPTSITLTTNGTTWPTGLQPSRVRITIERLQAETFTEVGFLWKDVNNAYQAETGSTFGYLSGTTAGEYNHVANIYEDDGDPINATLGKVRQLFIYSNGGGSTKLLIGDLITGIDFEIGGSWVSYLQ